MPIPRSILRRARLAILCGAFALASCSRSDRGGGRDNNGGNTAGGAADGTGNGNADGSGNGNNNAGNGNGSRGGNGNTIGNGNGNGNGNNGGNVNGNQNSGGNGVGNGSGNTGGNGNGDPNGNGNGNGDAGSNGGPALAGGLKIEVGGYYFGQGSAAVTATSAHITATVEDAAQKKKGTFVADLLISNGHFTGSGSVMGQSITVEGRVDAPDVMPGKTKTKDAVLKSARLVGTFHCADGHHGRIVGQQGISGNLPQS